MPTHVVAATTTAPPSSARPMPSRRCIGSRSRALLPTWRTAAPAVCAATIHIPVIACPIHSIRITNGLVGCFFCGRPPLPPPDLPRPLAGLPLPLADRLELPERERAGPAGGVRETVLPCGRVPLLGGPLFGTRVAMLPTVTRSRRSGPMTRRGSRGRLNAPRQPARSG